ncbi:MAG: DinB family protein [Actinomycetota bacterium]
MSEERIVAPDPVAEPDAYQQALLDMLGGRDPIQVLAATPEIFEEKTYGLDVPTLQRAPEPNEWSVEELLKHFFHGEIVYSFRWRITLAQDGVAYPGYDQDEWNSLAASPFPEMLAAFAALRRANVMLFEETPREQWSKVGLHAERGPESFELTINLLAGHDLAHLKQLDQTLAAVVDS